ncbi:MAG: hypothetical protein RL194_886 [Pseudomonadota bacterium]
MRLSRIPRFIIKPALLFGLALFSLQAHAVSSISIRVGHLQSGAAELRDLKLDYSLASNRLALSSRYKEAGDGDWQQAGLDCARLLNSAADTWQCEQGRLKAGQIDVPFALKFIRKTDRRTQNIRAELALTKAAFSDAAGLRAGENVSGNLVLQASRTAQSWRWQLEADWNAGEVFWQPFYIALAGNRGEGHSLRARGAMDAQSISIDDARLSLFDVGAADFSAELRRADRHLHHLHLTTGTVNLETLYPLILKPLLEKTALNNLELAGRGDLRLHMRDGELKSAQLNLQEADIEDRNGRFALYKINATLPWDYDQPQNLSLAYAGGHLLRVPLGRADIVAAVNRYALTASRIELPVFDGGLRLKNVSAAWIDKQWHWHLRADILPIDMAELSRALHWPVMQGQVAATIPLVTYSRGDLNTDGDMRFELFDGSITVKNLAMQSPLGIAPRLAADLEMRNLDLGTLTRTFSFGAIEGKLDGDVKTLRLANWKPVHFDAAIYSSPGKYPKKISQRAVENISSLGGAGAAAAIQRSFLRFFDQFNYDRLGLNCRLRNDTCEMSGVESTSEGYVIVKGRGIPSITVLGYNRNVSWGELLERLKRVTAGNSKPIIE